MQFTFSDDQLALRRAVHGFLAAECPTSRLRALADDPAAVDALWDRVTALGWAGLLVPVEQGGLGLGMVDALGVLEETGRVVFPGPSGKARTEVHLERGHVRNHSPVARSSYVKRA